MIDLTRLATAADETVKTVLIRSGLADSRLISKIEVTASGDRLDVEMPEYFEFVERGRRPGRFPPVSVIIDWIREKGISVPGGFSVRTFAFLIARNIAERGLKARPFIEQLTLNLADLSLAYIDEEITKQLKDKLK